jgi:hypothetical protein
VSCTRTEIKNVLNFCWKLHVSFRFCDILHWVIRVRRVCISVSFIWMTRIIVFLFYLFVVYCLKLSVILNVQQQKIIENNVARNSHNKIWGTIIVFVWRDWGEPWTMSVGIGCLYFEIKLWTLEIQMLTIWPHNLFFVHCSIRMLLCFLGGTNADNLTKSFIVYVSFSISMLLSFLANTNADNFGPHLLLFIYYIVSVCSFIFLQIQRLTAWAHNLFFFLNYYLVSMCCLIFFISSYCVMCARSTIAWFLWHEET